MLVAICLFVCCFVCLLFCCFIFLFCSFFGIWHFWMQALKTNCSFVCLLNCWPVCKQLQEIYCIWILFLASYPGRPGYEAILFLLWCVDHPILVCRYSAVRRQFGPTPDEEVPVLEYQLQVGKLSLLMRDGCTMCVSLCRGLPFSDIHSNNACFHIWQLPLCSASLQRHSTLSLWSTPSLNSLERNRCILCDYIVYCGIL